MTRNELIAKWCAAEGGKKSALDAPQAREAYAKLRAILIDYFSLDLNDVIARRGRVVTGYPFAMPKTFKLGKRQKP